MKSKSPALTDEMIAEIARRFRLLGEPVRLRLLKVLESGERSVNELAEILQTNQANISRHLASLFSASMLRRRRSGNNVYYSIADPAVFKLCEIMCESAREQMRARLGALTRQR